MTDIPWQPDDSWRSANRAETATVGRYELIAVDMPATARLPAAISWELYGPPYYTTLLAWGKCASFEEAKAVAEAALKEIRGKEAS